MAQYTRIFLTTTGTHTWIVPFDWNNSSNTIEVLGGGGSATGYGGNYDAGSGGGYAIKTNLSLTPGASITYNVGAAGGNTWFNGATIGASSVGATGGGDYNAPGAFSTGDSGYTGGQGGGNGFDLGGGGAAGPHGNGGNASGATGGTGDNGNTPANTAGTTWDATHGCGGGANSGGTSPLYGAGGGTSGTIVTNAGSQGIIVITFTSTGDNGKRYWVGGTASWESSWDMSSLSPWSNTSGGSGDAYVPTSSDTVFFDGNSGSSVVTLGIDVSVVSIDCTGFTGTLAQSTYTLTTTGNFTGASGMTWSGTGADTFGWIYLLQELQSPLHCFHLNRPLEYIAREQMHHLNPPKRLPN